VQRRADFCGVYKTQARKCRYENKFGQHRFIYFAMRRVMGTRPDHIKPPAHLSKSPPLPAPAETDRAPEPEADRLDPVRYGDWEYKGLAIDF
jgi:hypothetical protein